MKPVPPSSPKQQSSRRERVVVEMWQEERRKAHSRRRHNQRKINPNFMATQEGKCICKSCDKSFVNVHSAKRHFKYYCPKGERLPPPTPPSAGSLMTCAYCSYECAASNCQELMRLHLARLHPEMFFVSERNSPSPCLSPWKMEHFKDIVVKIVFPRFLLKNGVSFSCSVCGKMYGRGDRFTQNRYQSTTHLIYHHTQEVREYLKDILEQSDAFLMEKLDNTHKEKSESYICDDEMEEALNESFSLIATESFPLAHYEKLDQKIECSNYNDKPILSPSDNELRSPSASLFIMLTCVYCSYECVNTQDAMERHLMLRHSETFFLSQRSSSSSSSWKNEHFKEIVTEIVFPKFILTDGISTSCSCSVCGKKYSKCKNITLNSNLLTVHLLSEHLQEVRDYLKGVLGQSDTSLREKLDGIRNTQKSIASPNVEDCSSSSKDTSELDPEFFSSSDPNPQKPEIEDKPLSPPPEQLQWTITRGRVRISVGRKRKKETDSPPSPSTKTKRPKVMCKFCNKSFANLQSAQRHWTHSCPKMDTPKPNTDSMLSCAYCEYECAKGEHMKKHLVRLHPEMFFLSERDTFLSRWKNSEQVFKIIVTEIAFPKFIQTNGISSSISCSCSICNREFSTEEGFARDRFYLKTRLIDDHLQEVRKCIKDIMGQLDDDDNDGASLQEKLCNFMETKCEGKQVEVIPLSGRSKHICEFCNKEFVSTSILKRHLNKYCKRVKGKIVSTPDADSSALTCAYCSYVCTSRPYHMKRHLVRQHPEMFFLSEKNDSSSWKNEHFKTIVMEILFPEFILTDGISISCSCSVCGKIYENGRSIGENRSMVTLHLIDEHIQEVREHLKDIMWQSDASLQEQLDNKRKRKSIDELMRIIPP